MLIVLLLIFHHGSGNPPYSELSAQWTFRVSFGIMAAMTLWLGMSLSPLRYGAELTVSLLPILQDRLLFHCPSSIKEERPS